MNQVYFLTYIQANALFNYIFLNSYDIHFKVNLY